MSGRVPAVGRILGAPWRRDNGVCGLASQQMDLAAGRAAQAPTLAREALEARFVGYQHQAAGNRTLIAQRAVRTARRPRAPQEGGGMRQSERVNGTPGEIGRGHAIPACGNPPRLQRRAHAPVPAGLACTPWLAGENGETVPAIRPERQRFDAGDGGKLERAVEMRE